MNSQNQSDRIKLNKVTHSIPMDANPNWLVSDDEFAYCIYKTDLFYTDPYHLSSDVSIGIVE